jgi:ElaB/YqjD/DUF883 family membrane-anchored ribosome-binding protein
MEQASTLGVGSEDERETKERPDSARTSRENDAESRFDEWRSEASDFDRRLRSLLREHPFAAVGVAIGMGFLVGRVWKEL